MEGQGGRDAQRVADQKKLRPNHLQLCFVKKIHFLSWVQGQDHTGRQSAHKANTGKTSL
jgi:hypothetical protein